jgi:5-methylthioribose kinase
MVRNGDAGQRPSTKVIDSEFAFYGPVGFDIGALWGNYVIAAARALAFRDESRAAWCLALIRETWDAFAREFRALWPSVRDPRVFRESTREAYLSKVQTDAWGFAAAKAARRVVGLAKVTDIETLDEPLRAGAARGVLHTARLMAIERHLSADLSSFTERIANVLADACTSGLVQPASLPMSPTPRGNSGEIRHGY